MQLYFSINVQIRIYETQVKVQWHPITTLNNLSHLNNWTKWKGPHLQATDFQQTSQKYIWEKVSFQQNMLLKLDLYTCELNLNIAVFSKK